MIQGNQLIAIFCLVNVFCKEFELNWKELLLTYSTPKRDTRKKRSPDGSQ